VRLGVFSDPVLFRLGDELTADRAYMRFVLGLAERVDELVIFGRVHPVAQRKPYAVFPRPKVRVVSLPYYEGVWDVRALVKTLRRSRELFAAELDRLDAVWLFGPNPLSLEFARIARRYGVPVALAIRQDFPKYISHRYPSRPDARLAAHALERAFRRIARSCPTVVVGHELERSYGHARALLSISVSQISSSDILGVDQALARPWEGPRRLLSVGRLDREKNPLLLADVLALLRADDPVWTLEVVGEGPARESVARRAKELGVDDALQLTGYVPAGEALWERYRASHAFLHVSLTEGVPSVIFEAQAAGTPVVASDVGGVGALIRNERTGLLVRPDDARAAADAIARLARDEELRRTLVTESLLDVADRTSDLELDRVASFFTHDLDTDREPIVTLVKP
jgi:glycosyltransferase involved in cell wall biosynthesis